MYPAEPKKHEWYMYTVAGHKSGDDPECKLVNSAFICFKHNNTNLGPHDAGVIRFEDPDFVKNWFILLQESKAKIDALNFDPAGAIPGIAQCANCDQSASENDFLCMKCRAEQEKG